MARGSSGGATAVPGVPRLHVVEGVSMLRPQAAVFEKTLQGFGDHQRARHLAPDTIKSRARVARQVQAFSGGYPWEPVWNHAMFDRWSAMQAKEVTTSTLRGYQGDLALYLACLCDPAYEWPQVCLERFGAFAGFALRDLNAVRHAQKLDRSSIYRLVKTDRPPRMPVELILALCKILQCTFEDLVVEVEPEPRVEKPVPKGPRPVVPDMPLLSADFFDAEG